MHESIFQEFLLIVMQLTIGKTIKNLFEIRFPKPKTGFPVFD